MFFGDTLDAVARVARISVRGRNKMTNFIRTRSCAAGLQGWRVVNNNIETKVNTLATMEK
jgi:hypothetical protein